MRDGVTSQSESEAPVRESSLQGDILARTKGDKRRLENFGRKVHSQSDEDGIIAEIFNRIGVTNRVFVEIGVEVGTECNTLLLLENGWSGLWIEGHPDYQGAIRWNQQDRLATGQLRLAASFVTADNVNDLIEEAGVRGDVDLFSLDIDSNDYHVFEALEVIRPRVLVMEHNHEFIPPDRYIMPRNDDYRWSGGGDYGSSLVSLNDLAGAKGYTLVGCGLYSPNGLYVRSDLVGDRFDGPFTPERLWNPFNYPKIASYPKTAT